jgi:glycyl-tRNA synthetase alpha subunit
MKGDSQMLEKINQEIEFQKKKLARKEKALEEYQAIIESGEDMNSLQSERRAVLLAERSLIIQFIENLEYIKEKSK